MSKQDALAELMAVIRRHRQHLGSWPNMHDEDAGMVLRSPVYDPWRRARAAVERAIGGLVYGEDVLGACPHQGIPPRGDICGPCLDMRRIYWREKEAG